MWQAEIRVDLGAVATNVARVRTRVSPSAEVMAVVKGNGYGHGMVPCARAALRGGATWLGACTVPEALELRQEGITAPVFAWLYASGERFEEAISAEVDLSAATVGILDEIVTAAARTGRPARLHLKVDTGLGRGGATTGEWPALCEAAAKAQADGLVSVVGVWSHFASSDEVENPSNDRQLAAFADAVAIARGLGLTPRYRHIANSAATLTRPDTHLDLVRVGIATYGLSPVESDTFGLRPAMTVRARVPQTKRVPAGHGVSYGHTYVTPRETTLALVPLGYADGVPRAAGNTALVRLGGRNRPIAGRVCMDQFVLDCDDDAVAPGDVAVLFGPGDDGEPTASDWAAAVGTINYEIVTRMGGTRVPRVYVDDAGEAAS